ncbi:hypothetical protein GPECTOR_291g782 [Gonium pectorale]|uniref:Uncharacterized protein n=1 Tax=Gonium pectorale TaxID=33097 RepID=A0A150FVW9_GONPE|nr:hypothetical protein GPECTOR_291g782 [Gonium pectorale]|eukprot:KXZ41764.1 hypothetical protein GPECTOR_291g782 [Gonium pectorale]
MRAPYVGREGPYQGAVGTLAAGTLWSGIFGSVYVPVRAAVDASVPPGQPAWGPALAAAAGSVAASSVRVPKQVVKSRMERGDFFCSLQAFELMLTREGPSALYRGWARSVAKNAPFDALLFLLYDTGKSRVTAALELWRGREWVRRAGGYHRARAERPCVTLPTPCTGEVAVMVVVVEVGATSSGRERQA